MCLHGLATRITNTTFTFTHTHTSTTRTLSRGRCTTLYCAQHMGVHGRYGTDQFELLLRHGITPIQRLHREAVSEHGDALALGARATMMPYATTVEQASFNVLLRLLVTAQPVP